MEDNGCIFTPIRQTMEPHFLQVVEQMSCKLKNVLVNTILIHFQLLVKFNIFSFNMKFEMIV